jgi:RAD51-like protein 2
VQIPFDVFLGCNGEAIYIDTEGSFMIERVYEMATAISAHLSRLVESKLPVNNAQAINSQRNVLLAKITVDNFMNGIHVIRVHDQTEFLAILHQLQSFLAANSRIKLIVIDSIAFPFRQALQDTITRTRILAGISQNLNTLAHKHSCAVVVMNHVTTRFDSSTPGTRQKAKIVPALGEQWSHCITNRVLLHWGRPMSGGPMNAEDLDEEAMINHGLDKPRIASLIKSPSRPANSVAFQVNELGIRDTITAVQVRTLCSSYIISHQLDFYCRRHISTRTSDCALDKCN